MSTKSGIGHRMPKQTEQAEQTATRYLTLVTSLARRPPTEHSIKELTRIMSDEDAPAMASLMAAATLLKWGWGPPKQFNRWIDEAYYSCENGRDFEFFKRGNKRGYKRGGRICTIKTFKDLPGPDSPRLVWASCKEAGVQQLEVLKMYSCCGVLMIKRVNVYPELTQ
jgi:hypothetical protein